MKQKLEMGKTMVTIKEIAAQAGVSTTTVSNVLHKKTSRVSPGTIEKIEALLEKNNYIPRLGLNALMNKSSHIVCILINTPEFAKGSAYEKPFYGGIIGNLEKMLREKGYYIMIFSDKKVEEIEKMTMGWNVDGIITISMPHKHYRKIAALSDKPIVSIDMDGWEKENEKDSYYLVTSEDQNGGQNMAQYLFGRGIKRIVYLSNTNHGADFLRCLGVRKAVECVKEVSLEECRLPAETAEREELYHQLLTKYAGSDTALFFSTDMNAAEMISCAARSKVKVPEEISVVGFDDDFFATIVYPQITTVRVDVAEKARLAVDLLAKLMNGENCSRHIYETKAEVIERESVKGA